MLLCLVFQCDKSGCESQPIARLGERDFKKRSRLDAVLQAANAHIQSGSYFGRIDRPYDIDRLVIHRVGAFQKSMPFVDPMSSLYSPILEKS